jgi:hypothetical protein
VAKVLINPHHCELAHTYLIALVMIYKNWFNNAQIDFHFASKNIGNFCTSNKYSRNL